jgi:hypothetical protein
MSFFPQHTLFESNWYAKWRDTVQQAVADVEKLERGIFSDPALGMRLQQIVERRTLRVAKLDNAGIVADSIEIETERNANGGYGGTPVMVPVKAKYLKVKIPFTGDNWSFDTAPTRSTVPSLTAEIGTNSLTIVVPDDENAERTVKTFCSAVQGNLDGLRQEYDRDRSQLEQAVRETADRRKAEIKAEADRDSKRSFPVRRTQ